jgi:hypothetical protein
MRGGSLSEGLEGKGEIPAMAWKVHYATSIKGKIEG